MSPEVIGAVVAAGTATAAGLGVIWKAGGDYQKMRTRVTALEADAKTEHARIRLEIRDEHERIMKDINGIGAGLRRVETDNSRRYHNVSLALTHVSPPPKEAKVVELLKEEK